MSEATLDWASLNDSAAATVDSGSTADLDLENLDDSTATSAGEGSGEGESGEKTGGEEIKVEPNKEDGTPKTEEEIAEEKKTKQAELDAKKLPGNKNTPENIRKTLKAIRDANPAENGEAVKTLHGAYERWEAAKKIFPKGVQEMKDAKALIDLVGGHDGYNTLISQKQAIDEVDQKLYSGDSSLIDDILSDLKAENKTDAFPKLAGAFLDKLKAEFKDQYYEVHGPHFVAALDETNLPNVFKSMVAGLSAIKSDMKPEEVTAAVQKVLGTAQRLSKWADDMKAQHGKKEEGSDISPERKKLEEDRKKFVEEQTKFRTNQTKAFREDVGKDSLASAQKAIVKTLREEFFNLPFFKGFPFETKRSLANGILSRLQQTLTADGVYQAQMKALWGAKDPSKSKLLEYHNTKVDSIIRDVASKEVQDRYPNYRKGGAAAGRVAAAAAKKETTNKTDAAATASGKPVYVPTKPKDLVRNEEITVAGREYKPSDLVTLEIMGRGFIKDAKGNYKLITWRKI